MRPIVIFGASGHGAVVADAIESGGEYEVAGFVDSTRTPGELVLGHPILGGEDALPAILNRLSIEELVIAVGDNWARASVFERLSKRHPQLRFPCIIHPNSTVARSAQIGAGSVLVAGAVVNSRAEVGRFCLLNTNCSLDHDSLMGDFASLAPNSATGGAVKIGTCSAIGIGATVIQRIEIGPHCVVGAGAVVTKKLAGLVVAVGCPARAIRSREIGEAYL